MKSTFENITYNEYNILLEILKNPSFTPADFFFIDPTIDGRVKELERCGFINSTNGALNITELGRAALVEYDSSINANRKERILEIVKFSIPTIISIIALIISITK